MPDQDQESLKARSSNATLGAANKGAHNGRYELLEFIAQGGMGSVYKAYDRDLDRLVAVKIVLADQSMQHDRQAIHEARALARVEHHNVMRVYDILVEDTQIWIVGEWLEGTSLADVKTPMPCSVAMAIMMQALEGLQVIHEKKILHRDIKPSNLMLTQDARVVLIDFGVAFHPLLSQGQTMAGSLRYIDPNILEGRHATEWTDIYSLALIIVELMACEPVLPELAPIAQYRFINRKLKERFNQLTMNTYPPLAELLALMLRIGVDDYFYQTPTPAKSCHKMVQNIWQKLTTESCQDYLEAWLRGYTVDERALWQAMSREAQKALSSASMPPKQKSRWLSFTGILDEPDRKSMASSKKFQSVKTPSHNVMPYMRLLILSLGLVGLVLLIAVLIPRKPMLELSLLKRDLPQTATRTESHRDSHDLLEHEPSSLGKTIPLPSESADPEQEHRFNDVKPIDEDLKSFEKKHVVLP